VDAKSTCWFSPTRELDVSFRRQTNDRHFVGGGGLTDFGLHSSWELKREWRLEGSLGVERWKFPILRATPATNVTAAIGVTFTPAFTSLR
jgi:hypothetical protein